METFPGPLRSLQLLSWGKSETPELLISHPSWHRSPFAEMVFSGHFQMQLFLLLEGILEGLKDGISGQSTCPVLVVFSTTVCLTLLPLGLPCRWRTPCSVWCLCSLCSNLPFPNKPSCTDLGYGCILSPSKTEFLCLFHVLSIVLRCNFKREKEVRCLSDFTFS